MAKRKQIKIFIIGMLLLGMILCGVQCSATIRRYTACVITVYDEALILRLNLPPEDLDMGSTYRMRTTSTVFESRLAEIESIHDLRPGMVVKATIRNFEASSDLLSPSIPDLNTVIRIETDGKMDEALFQAGIDELYNAGFNYENGRPVSRLQVDLPMP